MKVSKLTGAELDYWVGKAEGLNVKIIGENCFESFDTHMLPNAYTLTYSPTSLWSQGGPIIHRERIGTSGPGCMGGPDSEKYWSAHIDTGSFPCISATGRTPLIAAMRAYVAGKFGEEVDDRQAHNV
jgi:hypothetical protein